MSDIRLIRWPTELSPLEKKEYARIWRAECGANLWDSQYPRAIAIMDGDAHVAVLVYIRITSHRINFGRMTMPAYRGRGYAGTLLGELIRRFPKETFECQNINPNLTDGLVRAGFRAVGDSQWTYRRTPSASK